MISFLKVFQLVQLVFKKIQTNRTFNPLGSKELIRNIFIENICGIKNLKDSFRVLESFILAKITNAE